MAIGDMRRMKKLCYDMRALAPGESIHLERVGKFVPTKTGDAIVIDLVPNQILVFIYPLGPAWQARMVSLGVGTSTVFAKVAESDKESLEWAFLALYVSAEKVIETLKDDSTDDADISQDDRDSAHMYMLGKLAIFDYILLGPAFHKPLIY